MLTSVLRELEADGSIHREQFNEIPPHAEYSFPERGRGLMPVFYEIMRWGFKHEADIVGQSPSSLLRLIFRIFFIGPIQAD